MGNPERDRAEAGGETPALVPLIVRTTCNVPPDGVRANVEANLKRGYEELRVSPANTRTLHIVGSGPSAAGSLLSLIQRGEDEDIMALNGAYSWLRKNTLEPEYFAMIDARAVNANFLAAPGGKTVHLFGSQSHPDVVRMVRHETVKMFHHWSDDTKDLTAHAPFWVGSGVTIGLVSLALGVALGYRHIVCHGYDSSYTDDHSHAFPQPQNVGQETFDVYVGDRAFRTTGAMAAQASGFIPLVERLKNEAPGLKVEITGEGLLQAWVATHHESNDPRTAELAKYRTLYSALDDYKMPQVFVKQIRGILESTPRGAYLDVGCGRGETLDLAHELGFGPVEGTESVPMLIAARENVREGVLPTLPFLDNTFDTVACWEVIEHLIPADVEPALLELYRVAAERVLLSAATGSHCIGGMELHPSARPEKDWDALLTKLGFKFDKCGTSHIGSPLYVIHKGD